MQNVTQQIFNSYSNFQFRSCNLTLQTNWNRKEDVKTYRRRVSGWCRIHFGVCWRQTANISDNISRRSNNNKIITVGVRLTKRETDQTRRRDDNTSLLVSFERVCVYLDKIKNCRCYKTQIVDLVDRISSNVANDENVSVTVVDATLWRRRCKFTGNGRTTCRRVETKVKKQICRYRKSLSTASLASSVAVDLVLLSLQSKHDTPKDTYTHTHTHSVGVPVQTKWLAQKVALFHAIKVNFRRDEFDWRRKYDADRVSGQTESFFTAFFPAKNPTESKSERRTPCTHSVRHDGWMERFVSSPSLFSGKYRTAVVQCHLAAKTFNKHFLFSGQLVRSGDSLLVSNLKLTDETAKKTLGIQLIVFCCDL